MNQLTELIEAIEKGDTGRVRELLTAKPVLANMTDADGATPLHHATLNGRRDVVRLLLDAGADINARDGRFGATPAGWAIEYLRGEGGLLGIEIEDMLFAIREKDIRWVRRLLTHHRHLVNARDRAGKPLADHARESGSGEIGDLFADRA